MALPSPAAALLPTLFLVVDAAHRVADFDAPIALRGAIGAAASGRRSVESLQWERPQDVRRAIVAALAGTRTSFTAWRLAGFTFDGVVFPVPATGSVLIAATDASEVGDIIRLATHDPLTDLWNRRHFIDQLEAATRGGVPAMLALIDVDRFGLVNEAAGHRGGDALLRAIADRLRPLEARGHFVARIGGNEFACLLFERDGASDHLRIVASLHQRLSVAYPLGNDVIAARSTIGCAAFPADGTGLELLQNAGIALASAKRSARGSVVTYRPAIRRDAMSRNRIESDLTYAIERNEFEMYYQPLISAKSGELVATEALLRWNHPQLGTLLPSSFLSVAEESDSVVDIGRWAMQRACRDAVSISQSIGRRLRLNVNVSPRHVQSAELVGDIQSALASSGWNAEDLEVEVTEQLLIDDVPAAATTLALLRGLGIGVAIDDFGTGYNTLSFLKAYPVSCIKIDGAFVQDAESNAHSRAICQSLTTLADCLHMNLIGEGVETQGQARFLEAIGCQELQGYHFGMPARVGEFIAAHVS